MEVLKKMKKPTGTLRAAEQILRTWASETEMHGVASDTALDWSIAWLVKNVYVLALHIATNKENDHESFLS